MEDGIRGALTFGLRVQDITIDNVTPEEAEAKKLDIIASLEALGATVVYGKYPHFEPNSPSVAMTYRETDDDPVEVVTKLTVEDFLATTEERFRRFPVKSFWEALTDHALLAHEGMDGRPPIPLAKLDTYDVPDKKHFYVGMEPCDCALRGYGYWGLDPRSIIRLWDEWDDIRPGRLYRFGARKQEFLGSLANRLKQDLD